MHYLLDLCYYFFIESLVFIGVKYHVKKYLIIFLDYLFYALGLVSVLPSQTWQPKLDTDF